MAIPQKARLWCVGVWGRLTYFVSQHEHQDATWRLALVSFFTLHMRARCYHDSSGLAVLACCLCCDLVQPRACVLLLQEVALTIK